MNRRIIKDISDFIFIEDTLEKTDAIFIPGGSYAELPERAAKLWKEGYAPYVIATGKYSVHQESFLGAKSKAEQYQKNYQTESEFYADVLQTNGVDCQFIIEETQSRCTADNAIFSKQLLDKKGMHLGKAILCCKAYHARRCLMFFQFYFPETEFFIAPVVGADAMDITKENWYQTERGLQKVLGEITKVGTQFAAEFSEMINV